MTAFQKAKQTVQKLIWPYGSIAKILRGYLKGYKFVVSENSGWSPILGRWEPENHKIFQRVIQPGQTVFDLGANNGIHSLLFSKLVGKNGKVYAFEPLPENVEEIKKNSALNNVENINIVQTAVGSSDGSVRFLVGVLNKQGSIMNNGNQSGKEVEVKLTTLQNFIGTKQVKPDFIKIDIEGAESDALIGMGELIRQIRPVFFIELHTPEQDRKVGAILKENGYKVYRVNPHAATSDLNIPHLERVKNLDLPHPHADGIWGTVLAIGN